MQIASQTLLAIEKSEKSLDDFLLFELQLDQNILADGVTAYREGPYIFLPLGALSNLLNIAVVINKDQSGATGFVITEDRPFLLDLNSNLVTLKNVQLSYDPKLVRVQDNQIFVESALYSKWFPVDMNINVSSLSLTVLPRELLPVQARLKREMQLQTNTSDHEQPNFVNYDSPYSLLDKPFIDQTFEGTLSGSKDTKDVVSGRYTTLMTADFLGLETHLFVNGSDKKSLENFRLTMGRDDPDGRLLGPLKARSFALGNINPPSLEYVARATTTGVGASISNRLLTRPTRYDQQNFIGDLLPGWDVELFHNGVLVGYQTSKERSQYEFKDIPLLFGGNDFKLIFHGPSGQIREEQTLFMLEDSMVLPGETYYTLTAMQLNDGSTRTMMQLDQSLSQRLSVTGGLTLNDVPTRLTGNVIDPLYHSRTFYNLGLRSYLNSFFLSTDGIISTDGGSLGAVSFKSGFWNSTLTVSHALLKDFTSDEFQPSDDPIISSSRANLDTAVPFLQSLPLSLAGAYQQTANRKSISSLSAKVSGYFDGVSLTNRISYLDSRGLKTTTGDLQLSGRIKDYNLRGGFTYDVQPTFNPTSLSLNGNINLSRDYNFTQSISNQFLSKEIRLDVGLNKSIGKYAFGVNTTGSSLGEYSIGLRLNIAIGFEPKSAEVFTSAQAMATTGTARVQAYVDNNANGVMDDGDIPLEGVGFMVNGGISPLRTNAKGMALVTHLPTRQRVNLGVDRNTIDDPQQTPLIRGVKLLPRPGKIAEIDFPFVFTTEIDGTILIDDDELLKPASNLNLELVEYSNREKIVSRATTAYDGYYILGEVPSGHYVLQIERAQANTLSIAKPQLKIIRVLPNSTFINGIDFTIKSPRKKLNAIIDQLPLQNFVPLTGPVSSD